MFKKYSKIKNSYDSKTINACLSMQECHDTQWYAVEKIHGANFSIIVVDGDVSFGSRNQKLGEYDSFYAYNTIRESLVSKAKALYELLGQNFTIYGELCGGSFPGIQSQISAVQKGVFYSPELEFFGFDIFLHDDNAFMDFSVARVKMLEADFYAAPVMGVYDKFENALKHPETANSSIPSILNYDIGDIDNIREGIVIRPERSFDLPNGNRAIFKKKTDNFLETKQQRKKEKKDVVFTDEQQAVWDSISEYITEARLRNVLSKQPMEEMKDMGRTIGAFSKDVIEEFNDEVGTLADLDKSDQKMITKSVNMNCANMVRSNSQVIINKEF